MLALEIDQGSDFLFPLAGRTKTGKVTCSSSLASVVYTSTDDAN